MTVNAPSSAGSGVPLGARPLPRMPRSTARDVPGALEHASGEVDEFDAALIAGAGGVPMPADGVSDEAEDGNGSAPGSPRRSSPSPRPRPTSSPSGLFLTMFLGGAHIETAPAGGGGGSAAAARLRWSRPAKAVAGTRSSGSPSAASTNARCRPVRIAFLRASWAELQRVQWPDRPQVSQATAVVLGFVAVAGVYLGAADWVAQKIINFIL